MKSIFLLFIILAITHSASYGQGYPITQSLGSDSTRINVKGAIQGRLINWSYTDTAAANLERIKGYPGAQIVTTTPTLKFWIRNATATGWIDITSGGGASQTWQQTLLVSGGSLLTQNNDIDVAGYDFRFSSADEFGVGADSVSISINQALGRFKVTGIPSSDTTLSLVGITANGYLVKTNKSSLRPYTFTNGLTESGGTVKWGGTLQDATTTIDADGNEILFDNVSQYSINVGSFDLNASSSVVVNTLPATDTTQYIVGYRSNGQLVKTLKSSSGWQLTGNSGTTAGTNFIGTTDAVAVVVKANNTERARFYQIAKMNLQGDVDVLGRVLKRNNVTYVDTARIISKNAPTYLSIPTYDGSDQSTHPDVYYNPNGWNGYKYWMAFTPYPNGNDALENPSIVVSNDGVTWSVPPGVTNPLVPQPTGIGFNYNADTDIMEGEDGKLYIFYIDGTTDVWVIGSSDGVTWSTPVKIIDMSVQTILSPSVILDNGIYKMYYVDLVESPNVIKYRTATSPTGTWSSPVSCSFSPIPSGKDLWHMNIDKTGTQYHAIITTSNSGTFNGNLLHFAVSDDGVNFSMKSTPVLGLGTGWDDARIYRSSLVYVDAGDESYYNLYYGAVNASNEWRIGLTKLKLSQYVRDISTNDKIINFASNDGTSRAILDSNNKLTLRRAGNLSPTGFYPQVEVKTDLTNENIQMGMFETSVGSNPYIIGNYSTASSNFHNTGFLSKRNDTLQLGMQLSNSGQFGGTAGGTAGGFFGIYDYIAESWLLGFNKSKELYLGSSNSVYGAKISASSSNYFSQNVGIGTTTPDSLLTVQNGFWSKRGVRLSGLASSANATDSMLVVNASNGNVGYRAIPTSGGGSGVTTLAAFGAGARLPGDTAAFTDSTIYGSFYNDGEDTLVITAMRIVMQGTNDTLTINVEWNDSLNTTGTKLKTAYAAANNNYTGNTYTSFDNTKIPPGNHVWCKSPTVIPGRRPTYLSVTLIGYKKRV